MLKSTPAIQNKEIGSIEKVGTDGYIVTSVDPDDEMFFGGKRLLPDFRSLIRFLMETLGSEGVAEVMEERGEDLTSLPAGGNGAPPKPIALYEEAPDV